jgi:hypothetical protein
MDLAYPAEHLTTPPNRTGPNGSSRFAPVTGDQELGDTAGDTCAEAGTVNMPSAGSYADMGAGAACQSTWPEWRRASSPPIRPR